MIARWQLPSWTTSQAEAIRQPVGSSMVSGEMGAATHSGAANNTAARITYVQWILPHIPL